MNFAEYYFSFIKLGFYLLLCSAVLCCAYCSVVSTPWTVAHQAPLSIRVLRARILEWVAMSSSRVYSQPRGRTQVSHIAGRIATREVREYWSGYPIPSPGDLPIPGTEPGSPALQMDSLPAELPERPITLLIQFNYIVWFIRLLSLLS